ncbi:MAG: adenylate/guanylate cyclase domain-containing protein, partial [Proteobacteria bacterium]|nr:adenylate/guanylate cyclase domain-containing protein [Pseudomonadota bacterium]
LVWSSVVLLPLVPALLALAQRSLGAAAQDVENAATPSLIGLLGLPMLPTAAVLGALLTGTVAQLGWRCLPRSAGLAAAGWCAGSLFAPEISYAASRVVDGLCLAFMLLYTTPLCALGYEETMRMHRMRERLRTFSNELERQRDRLMRYVAAPVAARLNGQTNTMAPLQRRWLTVAFVDITEFTALTERLEPEDLTSLLDAFFATLSAAADRYGGSLHKFLGDGALISFGEVESLGRRGDAQACVAMLGQLETLVVALNNAARARVIPAVLAVRAGVASGYCSVGDFGAGRRLEYTMIGSAVNLASRLEGLAASGEIWAAQATRDLVGADLFDSLGTFVVKGVTEPVAAFRLRVTGSVDASQTAI